jgi:hypothetical protein
MNNHTEQRTIPYKTGIVLSNALLFYNIFFIHILNGGVDFSSLISSVLILFIISSLLTFKMSSSFSS